MNFRKILIYIIAIYLIFGFIAWFIHDNELEPDLALQLEHHYVMQKGLKQLPEFQLMGINARHESVISAYGKSRYYQGWAEYYAYVHRAFRGIMELQRDDPYVDAEIVHDAQELQKKWQGIQADSAIKDHLDTETEKAQQGSDAIKHQRIDAQLQKLFNQEQQRLKKFEKRQQIYRVALAQSPRVLFTYTVEEKVAQTLNVLHWMTLKQVISNQSSVGLQQQQLLNYLNDLQRWYATCSDQHLCVFYLHAISETLDLMVVSALDDPTHSSLNIEPVIALKPLLERMYVKETAQLRIMLHMIGSHEVYAEGARIAKENPEALDEEDATKLKWIVQPLMRIFVLHNDSANLYWIKHQTMLQLAAQDPDQIHSTGPIDFDVPKRFFIPKNLFGKLTAWVATDLEYQFVAYHKVQHKIDLIKTWQNNDQALNLKQWQNVSDVFYQEAPDVICKRNPIFDYFLGYRVQVRPQCIGEQGMINLEKNVFQTQDEYVRDDVGESW